MKDYMSNLKPIAFIKEIALSETTISPEIKPGVTVVYKGSEYTVIRIMDNSLGWVMYSDRPSKEFFSIPGGVAVPFDSPLYERPMYLATKKSTSLVKDILHKLKETKPKGAVTSIPANFGPMEIMQYVRDGHIGYEEGIQFLAVFDPRWLVTLARHFKKPSHKIESILLKGKYSELLADYAIRAVRHRLDTQAEDIIKLNPQAWQSYTFNLRNSL
jgi:hypothetical protein